jgi:hypothetical protein
LPDVLTCTVTVQEPFPGIEPPVNVTLEALTLVDPPQVVLARPETIIPLGKVSVSGAVRIAMVLLGLLKVIVRVENPPVRMAAGLKDLRTVGATRGVTVKVATAGPVLLPLPVCSAPIGRVLV